MANGNVLVEALKKLDNGEVLNMEEMEAIVLFKNKPESIVYVLNLDKLIKNDSILRQRVKEELMRFLNNGDNKVVVAKAEVFGNMWLIIPMDILGKPVAISNKHYNDPKELANDILSLIYKQINKEEEELNKRIKNIQNLGIFNRPWGITRNKNEENNTDEENEILRKRNMELEHQVSCLKELLDIRARKINELLEKIDELEEKINELKEVSKEKTKKIKILKTLNDNYKEKIEELTDDLVIARRQPKSIQEVFMIRTEIIKRRTER